jgi:hypothetical protein
VQIVPVQTNPVAQSAVVAQLVRQAPFVPQMYGLHDWAMPAAHMPEPSHRPDGVAVPIVQLAMLHIVVAG